MSRYGSVVYEYCDGTGRLMSNLSPTQLTRTSHSRSGNCIECGRRIRGYRGGTAAKHKDTRTPEQVAAGFKYDEPARPEESDNLYEGGNE